MKNTLLILLALTVVSPSFAQEKFAITVGAATPKFDAINLDLGKSISYYAGVSVEDKISAPIGYEGYIQFSNYRFDKASYKSVDVGFMFKYYPTSKFYLAPGFMVSKIVHISYDGEAVSDADKVAIPCYTLGVGYEFTDHVILTARYNGSLEKTFDYILNLGVKYRF